MEAKLYPGFQIVDLREENVVDVQTELGVQIASDLYGYTGGIAFEKGWMTVADLKRTIGVEPCLPDDEEFGWYPGCGVFVHYTYENGPGPAGIEFPAPVRIGKEAQE